MADESSVHKGKIGRCPPHVREEVCRRLFEGQTGRKICTWLNEHPDVLRVLDEHFGEEPVTEQNLSEWRKNGFQKWLARRDQLETTKQLADYSLQLAEGMTPTEGAARIAGGQLLMIFEDLDIEAQRTLLKEKPGTYIALLDALARVKKSEADAEKARQAKITNELNTRRLEQNERKLALDEKRFQVRTAELFLEWFDNETAKRIAEGKAARSVKIEQLREAMFGPADQNPDGQGEEKD
jgi:hypothetical protein